MTKDQSPFKEDLAKSVSSLSLEDQNTTMTFYERLIAIYYRDSDYKLLSSHSFEPGLDYEKLLNEVCNTADGRIFDNNEIFPICVQVFEKPNIKGGYVGLVIQTSEKTDFDEWMTKLVLSTSKIDYPATSGMNNSSNLVVSLYESILKNTVINDKWSSGGRDFFKERVDFFVSRNIRIEAVLPAFPCKSSNKNKVISSYPDKGEEIALRKLCEFATEVKKVYSPGILIWIVSDGHVFSDCIGVDDNAVNKYGDRLKSLYKEVKGENKDELIKFCSLLNIFDLNKFPFDDAWLDDFRVEHHLGTKIDSVSERCRQIMMYSCDTDAGSLKEDIKTPGHPRLSLYRGFAKFMEEDLSQHPLTVNLSKKKFKKTVSKVAFEMIKRNDAYSNLVEVMFPVHLRLSIHAHNNSGPKFGIRLLGSNTCKVVQSLDQCSSPDYNDLLHIPTPWHNAIFKLEGDDYFYITRSDVLYQAADRETHSITFDEKDKLYYVSARLI